MVCTQRSRKREKYETATGIHLFPHPMGCRTRNAAAGDGQVGPACATMGQMQAQNPLPDTHI